MVSQENIKLVSFLKRQGVKRQEKKLPHFVQKESPPYTDAEGEPAFLPVQWCGAAPPLWSGSWRRATRSVVELISGPKLAFQLVLLAVPLTFDSGNTSGSPGSFTSC